MKTLIKFIISIFFGITVYMMINILLDKNSNNLSTHQIINNSDEIISQVKEEIEKLAPAVQLDVGLIGNRHSLNNNSILLNGKIIERISTEIIINKFGDYGLMIESRSLESLGKGQFNIVDKTIICMDNDFIIYNNNNIISYIAKVNLLNNVRTTNEYLIEIKISEDNPDNIFKSVKVLKIIPNEKGNFVFKNGKYSYDGTLYSTEATSM